MKAWNNKGLALDKLGRYQEAVDSYEKALKIDPGYVKAWNNKGLALDKLGRYQEAVDSYERALSIDPNDATVWHNKGLALTNWAGIRRQWIPTREYYQ